jgi:hypothetical protein
MPLRGHDPRDPGVASDIASRVGDVLERAEARAREIRERADRSASEMRRTARHEAEGIAKEARRAAAGAAHERVRQISELRASIAARAGSLVEGLEGGELTGARLEALVAALGQAADRVLAEAGGEAPGAATPRPPRAAGERATAPLTAPPPGVQPAPAFGEGSAAESAPIHGEIPEGAPIARRPERVSSARFAAVMMAIEGSGRDDVAEHLAREHGLADATELLDEVFGSADAPA